MKVAIYTIALNERQFVDKWFEASKDADYLLIADTGSSTEVVTKITKRVNGGTIGLADRIKHFKEYHALLA